MQYSQKNFMRIIGNDQKNNGENFWEILERIIGKIVSIIGIGLAWLVTNIHSLGQPLNFHQKFVLDRKLSKLCQKFHLMLNFPVPIMLKIMRHNRHLAYNWLKN